MKKYSLTIFLITIISSLHAQSVMTPELLWQLGRVSGLGITQDGRQVIYRVSTPNLADDRSTSQLYSIPVEGGAPAVISSSPLPDPAVSPDGKYKLFTRDVKVTKVKGAEIYPDLTKSNVRIYESLNYRHWDEWEDGAYSHLFYSAMDGNNEKDLMDGEPHDCPQKPFGDESDYTWSPDTKRIIYVTKKKWGKDYAVSTNTDLYQYDITTGSTTNLTEGRMGYDVAPTFSSKGVLAFLSMKRDGYESDKNDIVVQGPDGFMNLTSQWDETVLGYRWSNDGSKLYFTAAINGTIQLFEVNYPGRTRIDINVTQITSGDFDITSLVGQSGNQMVVTRTDMNHASELYRVDLTNGKMTQLTHVNDSFYSKLKMSKVERRFMNTTDNKKMLVWVIYPPDFDPTKKYPTLLYCQGGPQSALTQFYSYRWNFQLMAAAGYIIVAPNRRGMPGHGVAWNEQISKDHGGQVMQDYLTAIDEMAKESFVDKTRLGAVGASYGGYSVFYLAGIHNKRFKTLVSHDGIFNLKSMYGTTEELFFVNWDLGGPYWDKSNAAAQKSYNQFDPSNLIEQWDTPILIYQGGKDYRVPDGQGMEAFQAAQLKGIKSRFIYLPDENHWVLHAQNAIVWQREFFKWLRETL